MGRRGEVYSKDIQVREQEDRECYMSRGQRIRNAKMTLKLQVKGWSKAAGPSAAQLEVALPLRQAVYVK